MSKVIEPGRLVIVGGGFAGLWAAAAAARLRALKAAAFEIVLIAPDPFHVIRVRCYEDDLDAIRVPLDAVLGPIGVMRHEAAVTAVDAEAHMLTLHPTGMAMAPTNLGYDRLLLAAGSVLVPPPCPGAAHAFDVDTYDGAQRLAAHVARLGAAPRAGRWSAVVIGAGLVGIELACELPGRLAKARAACPDPDSEPPVRVVLIDRASRPGAAMGAAAPAIGRALAAARVEIRSGDSVGAIDERGVTLADGEAIPAATVITATGMRASPLAAMLPVSHDALGRLPVDGFLAVEGMPDNFAAGDIARARADSGHDTVMSCQHARPMGRIAGHNAACEILGCRDERIAFSAPDYVTVLDLGDWGAVYTSGWDRERVVSQGAEAKVVKRRINRERIDPPRNGDRDAILAAAAPVIQARPAPPTDVAS